MNTANWIPDLFMKRVMEGGEWTLFSPSDCPDLHDRFGRTSRRPTSATRRRRARRDQAVQDGAGQGPVAQDAVDAVRDRASLDHLQGRLQRAQPQQHVGVVHSSNLCTEITLNTSETEIAVCNLGSVNLAQHLKDGGIDHDKLKKTVATAMRMLDNVIDINYYAVKKARNSNPAPPPGRPGHHGFPGCAARAARALRQRSRRWSSPTARWRRSATTPTGPRPSWRGARALFQLPRLAVGPRHPAAGLASTCWPRAARRLRRGGPLTADGLGRAARRIARARHAQLNCVAIAPTATISNIIGVDASIEPTFGNLSVKSEPVGRVHRRQRAPGARPKRLGLWDDGDGRWT